MSQDQAKDVLNQSDDSYRSMAKNILEESVAPDVSQRINNYDQLQSKYGTVGQQVLTGLEGTAQGLAGPLATGAEALLSHAGVEGLTPEDQEMRAKANPVTRYGTEVGGFGLGAMLGIGEAGVLAKLGEGVAGAEKLAKLSPLLRTGIRTGAEVAALQAGNEVSKAINQDPNQSLGSAAINVGLSGILGGAGGVAIGAVPKLWNTVGNKLKVAQLSSDFMDELSKLQGKSAPAVEQAIAPKNSEMWFDPFQKRAIPAIPDAAESVAPKTVGFDPFTKQSIPISESAAEEIKPPRMTAGRKLAKWVYDSGAKSIADKIGNLAAGTIGGLAGALVGHPAVGAWMGEKMLGDVFSSLAKPLAEKMTNVDAIKSTIDYAAQVAKGDYLLGRAAKAFFQSGELIPQSLLPTDKTRDDLKKSLDHIQNQDNMINIGGHVGYYLPDHSVAAGEMAAKAQGYFNSLKPAQPKNAPLDKQMPISRVANNKYDRALDIAQQPLLVMEHAKNGTLQKQDITTLNTLYPGLHKQIVSRLSWQMNDHLSKGKDIPYQQRRALGMLMGSPLDSTQTLRGAQAIISANAGQISEATQPQGKQHKASGSELSQINKVNKLYFTAPEQRRVNRGK